MARRESESSARWEQLDSWLGTNEIEAFTVHDLAKAFKITVPSATRTIQAYLVAQRREDSDTLFVLKRMGRTRAAVWSVGERVVDARAIGFTLYDDVVVKVKRGFEPDLKRLAERNPKAAKYVDRRIESVVGAALVLLRNAVDSQGED